MNKDTLKAIIDACRKGLWSLPRRLKICQLKRRSEMYNFIWGLIALIFNPFTMGVTLYMNGFI